MDRAIPEYDGAVGEEGADDLLEKAFSRNPYRNVGRRARGRTGFDVRPGSLGFIPLALFLCAEARFGLDHPSGEEC